MNHKESEIYEVAILGQGFVGLPLALMCLRAGYKVIGIDIDENVVSRIKGGVNLPPEVPSSELTSFLFSGNYRVSSNPKEISSAKVVIVCVPTPINQMAEPDLLPLIAAVDLIDKYAKSATLVVNESTSYPGTLKEIFQKKLEVSNQNGAKLCLAVAPERINPGDSIPLKEIPRVIGGIDMESTKCASDFYESLGLKVHVVSSSEIAETSKLLENTFRQVNISLMNELQEIFTLTSINLREAIDAASTKPYGFMPFSPSAGIGGHCIPVDPEYLQYFARGLGQQISMVHEATRINNEMGEKIVKRIENRAVVINQDTNVLLVGVTYKANIRDTRHSPAERILEVLKKRGAKVFWHDNFISEWKGQTSSRIQSRRWDVSIIITPQNNLEIDLLVANSSRTFDCTGTFLGYSRVEQI